ncbi:hypothetical protein ABL78_4484 [Leptomonas seymouri]|uniref:Uncharacterized protein n=1 Tax=Leptomonas seymouri TaxID=5684 RepID=A0A0N1IK74_LEPSE|nr:hypothetical protein ABL78_4484 [Leptomonas seymouri]|eukprot:KPI86453.1 hypothetical protein ABL78_4484 [Leptomonas seymouri]
MFPCLTEPQPGHFLICVHAKPGARNSAFASPLTPQSTQVDLRIAAPPVDGQANAELLRFLDEVVEQGLRELQSDPTRFLEGTSYTRVLAADTEPPLATGDAGDSSGRKAKKKVKGTNSSASRNTSKKTEGGKLSASSPNASNEAFPGRVEVTLLRGGTSREKTVLALFPGARAQLIAILEKASQS